MVAVAQRVFAKELREAQMAARRELRELHKEQREQLRNEYAAKSQSMRISRARMVRVFMQALMDHRAHGEEKTSPAEWNTFYAEKDAEERG